MPEEQTSKLSISKRDIDDPELYRLNQILNFIGSQITAIRNNGRFNGTTQTDKITTQLYSQKPMPNDVVPWGTIERFLSPAAIRQAFVTNNWFGTPVRPIGGIDIPANTGAIVQAVVDTHDNREAAYPAGKFEEGSFYYETDRDSLYQVHDVSGTLTWIWIAGQMTDTLANIPVDLVTADAGFLFKSTTAVAAFTYQWSGSAWVIIDSFTSATTVALYLDAFGSNVIPSKLTLQRSRGSDASPSNISSGDYLGAITVTGMRNSAPATAASILVTAESLPSGSTVAGNIQFQTTDSAASTATRWRITADGSFEPDADATYDIGSSTDAVNKTWTVDLNVKQSGSAGDVLTNDGSDNAVWQAPAASGSAKFARSTATDTLTTSFADMTGCSLSLDQNGVWAVFSNFCFYKALNDDECLGQLVYDGSAQTGYARGPGVDTADDVRAMSSQCWTVTVTSQPKTAKLQAKKNAGTGSSTSDINNTTIMALFIG